MKIRMLQDAQVEWKDRKSGDVLDLDGPIAESLIRVKLAEVVPDDTDTTKTPDTTRSAIDQTATAPKGETATSTSKRPNKNK